jgi:hypothetical protein
VERANHLEDDGCAPKISLHISVSEIVFAFEWWGLLLEFWGWLGWISVCEKLTGGGSAG